MVRCIYVVGKGFRMKLYFRIESKGSTPILEFGERKSEVSKVRIVSDTDFLIE